MADLQDILLGAALGFAQPKQAPDIIAQAMRERARQQEQQSLIEQLGKVLGPEQAQLAVKAPQAFNLLQGLQQQAQLQQEKKRQQELTQLAAKDPEKARALAQTPNELAAIDSLIKARQSIQQKQQQISKFKLLQKEKDELINQNRQLPFTFFEPPKVKVAGEVQIRKLRDITAKNAKLNNAVANLFLRAQMGEISLGDLVDSDVNELLAAEGLNKKEVELAAPTFKKIIKEGFFRDKISISPDLAGKFVRIRLEGKDVIVPRGAVLRWKGKIFRVK